MSLLRKISSRTAKRLERVRKRLRSSNYPRVSVFRSLNHIYAQVIDDKKQTTLASCSSLELPNLKGNKQDIAHAVGLELAKKAIDQGINIVVFDRGSALYHGRVKSVAEGLREGGLQL